MLKPFSYFGFGFLVHTWECKMNLGRYLFIFQHILSTFYRISFFFEDKIIFRPQKTPVCPERKWTCRNRQARPEAYSQLSYLVSIILQDLFIFSTAILVSNNVDDIKMPKKQIFLILWRPFVQAPFGIRPHALDHEKDLLHT